MVVRNFRVYMKVRWGCRELAFEGPGRQGAAGRQPAAPLGVPVFPIEMTTDANQVLASQCKVMRHGGVDGRDAGRGPNDPPSLS